MPTTKDMDTVVQTLVAKAAFADAVVDLIKEHCLIKPPKRRMRRVPAPPPRQTRDERPKHRPQIMATGTDD